MMMMQTDIRGTKRTSEEVVAAVRKRAAIEQEEEEVKVVGLVVQAPIVMPCLKTFFETHLTREALNTLIPMNAYMRIRISTDDELSFRIRFLYDNLLYQSNPLNTYHADFISEFSRRCYELEAVFRTVFSIEYDRLKLVACEHAVYTTAALTGDVSMRVIRTDPSRAQLFPRLLTVNSPTAGISRLFASKVMVKVLIKAKYADGTFERFSLMYCVNPHAALSKNAMEIKITMGWNAILTPVKSIIINGLAADRSKTLKDFVHRDGFKMKIIISH